MYMLDLENPSQLCWNCSLELQFFFLFEDANSALLQPTLQQTMNKASYWKCTVIFQKLGWLFMIMIQIHPVQGSVVSFSVMGTYGSSG